MNPLLAIATSKPVLGGAAVLGLVVSIGLGAQNIGLRLDRAQANTRAGTAEAALISYRNSFDVLNGAFAQQSQALHARAAEDAASLASAHDTVAREIHRAPPAKVKARAQRINAPVAGADKLARYEEVYRRVREDLK